MPKSDVEKAKKKRKRDKHDRDRDAQREIAKKGVPFKVSGKTYYMRPPGHAGTQALENWIRERRKSPLELAKLHLDSLNPEQQAMLLDSALAQEARFHGGGTESELDQAADTREGATMLFYYMIRENHPEMTMEDCGEFWAKAADEIFDEFVLARDKIFEDGEPDEDEPKSEAVEAVTAAENQAQALKPEQAGV